MERTSVLVWEDLVGDGSELLRADGSGARIADGVGAGAVCGGAGLTSVKNGSGVSEACDGAGDAFESRAWSHLAEAEAALRSVSLEGSDEDELCRVVAGAGQVRALADALTLRAASGLEALRAGSAREALVAGAKLSGRAAKRVTEAARQVEEMPNVGRMLDAGDLPLESLFALGSAARQCGAVVVDGSDELLYQAAARDAGSFSRVARRFAQRHDPTAGGDLLKGQRNSRKADLFVGSDGMGVLKGELDPVSFGLLEQAVDERKDYLWRKDGGRDGTPDAVRHNGQRTMDAVFVDEFCADEGPTDIENLVALCGSCHLWLHRTKRRVVREADAYGAITWSTAPRVASTGEAKVVDPGEGNGTRSRAGEARESGYAIGGRAGRGRREASGVSCTDARVPVAGRDPPGVG